MGSKSVSVPEPPGLTSEEQAFLQNQNMTLQKLNSLLDESSLQNEQTRNTLLNLSGLYTPRDVTEEVGATQKAVVDTGKINQLRSKLQSTGPGQGTVRQVLGDAIAEDFSRRGINPDLQVFDLGGLAVQTFDEHVRDNQASPDAASYYGWGTSEKIPGEMKTKTVYDVNKEAVEDLKSRLKENIDYESNISQAAKEDIMDWLNREPTEYEKAQEEIGLLQTQRQLQALKGELPLSEATRQQKQQEFEALKENLSRSGNAVRGDVPEAAVGLSTSGNEALEAFNKRWGLLEDAERRGELTSGEASTLSRYGLTSDIGARDLSTTIGLGSSYNPYSTTLGLLNTASGYGASSSIPNYASLLNSYSTAMAPYADQRTLSYQTALQNAALSSQGSSALKGLLGYGAGALIGSGNPYAMGAGAGLLGYGILS